MVALTKGKKKRFQKSIERRCRNKKKEKVRMKCVWGGGRED